MLSKSEDHLFLQPGHLRSRQQQLSQIAYGISERNSISSRERRITHSNECDCKFKLIRLIVTRKFYTILEIF